MTPHPDTVLLVDDDADLRRQFKAILSYEGYHVHEAADGLAALRHIDHSPPSLIVLDLGLPGLDGVAVLQEVAAHAHTRRIPVVIVTGRSSDLSHLDVPCVLRKPVAPDALVRAIRECLAAGARGAGA